MFICALFFTTFAHASVGTTLSVNGRPQLTLKADASRLRLGPGRALDAGDKVDTDNESNAKIHLIDETILDVGPLSNVTLPRLVDPESATRQVLIDVERGRVRAKVNRELERSKGRFEIHSYAASLGVEGTDFVVEVAAPDREGRTRTTITVLEGVVAVRGARDRDNPAAVQLRLRAGERFTAYARLIGDAVEQDAFDANSVEKLNAASLEQFAKAARLDNETFLQAVSVANGFGSGTMGLLARTVEAEPATAGAATKSSDVLFRKRFRDDEFATHSNLVSLTIGFPQ